jgi:glycolate oxidase
LERRLNQNVAERLSASATATSTGLRELLEEVAGRDDMRTDEGALITFSTVSTPLERGRPDAVVLTGDRRGGRRGAPLRQRAGRPGHPARVAHEPERATVPHRGGIVLVLTRMNKIKEVSDAQLVAVCEPGMESAGQPARKHERRE